MHDFVTRLIEFLPIDLAVLPREYQLFLVLVVLFMVSSFGLYLFTRGKEFAICALGSVLFLVPFVRFI